jgi:hypothetical protein
MTAICERYENFEAAEMEFKRTARSVLDRSIIDEQGWTEALALWANAAKNLEVATAAIATAKKRVR